MQCLLLSSPLEKWLLFVRNAVSSSAASCMNICRRGLKGKSPGPGGVGHVSIEFIPAPVLLSSLASGVPHGGYQGGEAGNCSLFWWLKLRQTTILILINLLLLISCCFLATRLTDFTWASCFTCTQFISYWRCSLLLQSVCSLNTTFVLTL